MSEYSEHYENVNVPKTSSCKWWTREDNERIKIHSNGIKIPEVQAMAQEVSGSNRRLKRSRTPEGFAKVNKRMEDFWISVPIVEFDPDSIECFTDEGVDAYLDRKPIWMPSYFVRAATHEMFI